MDEKNIFIATSHMKSKITWDRISGNEWSFVGEGSYFKRDEVQQFIDSFFAEEELYLVVDRHNAWAIPKLGSSGVVKSNLNDRDVTLCNPEFNRMIEFSHIGVAKHGCIDS